MQISKDFAGFTGGQADTLRKAVGKKNIDMMRKVRVDFVQGAVDFSGADPKLAEKFWDQLEEFANYCFNKSHAACYGLISYWTAYLKAHYPEAFMAALMTSDQNDIDRLAIEITECKHMGITVLSPDVNESYVEFAVVPDKKEIRFGMAAVKGVGVAAVEEILRAREADGPFTSIEDFARRVSTSKFNKKAWESVIKSGGFDKMGDRSDLLFNLETLQSFASKTQKETLSGQTNLFGGSAEISSIQPTVSMQLAPVKHTEKERLVWERELLGLYISAHPLDNYDAYFEEQVVPLNQMTAEVDGKRATVGGLVSTVRTIVTKGGSKMAFVGIEDKSGEAEVIVFPGLYSQISAQLVQDSVLRATGKISARDKDGNLAGEAKMIADDIQFVTDQELNGYESTGTKMRKPKPSKKVTGTRVAGSKDTSNANSEVEPKNSSSHIDVALLTDQDKATKNSVKKLFVHIRNPDDHDALLMLKQICSQYNGLTDIVLVLGAEKKSAIKLPFKIDPTDELMGALVKILGEDAVVLS
jgi:DNA polymerase-3 subunit alpha